MQRFLFHLIGVSSVLGLLGLALLALQRMIDGEAAGPAEFFEKYRGAEPFMIFIFPVVLIGSIAWIWDLVRNFKK